MRDGVAEGGEEEKREGKTKRRDVLGGVVE